MAGCGRGRVIAPSGLGLSCSPQVKLTMPALEMLFPADPATIAIVKAMVEEEAAQAIESGVQKAS
jgi:hypothetical protein